MIVRRLLLVALLVPTAAWLPTGAAADVTVPTTLPTAPSLPVATPSLPVSLPTTPVTEPSGSLPSLATTPSDGTPGDDPTEPGLPLPTTLPERPAPPSVLPALPLAPPQGGGGGSGQPGGGTGRGQAGPIGGDVLPAELETQLCTLLTTITGHLPGEVRGLPGEVIAKLPPQITSVVPADLLRTVTLQCPAAAPSVRADQPTTPQFQAAPARVLPRQAGQRPPARTPVERTGLGSLPHTGLVVALPLLALTALLTGTVLYRRNRPLR